MQHKLLQAVESKQVRPDVPDFQIGDTIIVQQKLLDGVKERIQAYEGQLIARSGRGICETITVRKIVQGEGVERIFPIHSPRIARFEVKRAGMVRRAKLYYIRDRVGKAVKIKEDKKRQTALDTSAATSAKETAAAKATIAREQQAASGGESKRAAKRKAKAEADKKK